MFMRVTWRRTGSRSISTIRKRFDAEVGERRAAMKATKKPWQKDEQNGVKNKRSDVTV